MYQERPEEALRIAVGIHNTIKWRRATAIDWTCSIRGRNNRCPGSVIQHEDGSHTGVDHNHAEAVDLPAAAKLVKVVKRKAGENLFWSPSAIVDNVLLHEIPESACPTLPKVEHLIRGEQQIVCSSPNGHKIQKILISALKKNTSRVTSSRQISVFVKGDIWSLRQPTNWATWPGPSKGTLLGRLNCAVVNSPSSSQWMLLSTMMTMWRPWRNLCVEIMIL